MKSIKLSAILFACTILFYACGGNSSQTTDDTVNNDSTSTNTNTASATNVFEKLYAEKLAGKGDESLNYLGELINTDGFLYIAKPGTTMVMKHFVALEDLTTEMGEEAMFLKSLKFPATVTPNIPLSISRPDYNGTGAFYAGVPDMNDYSTEFEFSDFYTHDKHEDLFKFITEKVEKKVTHRLVVAQENGIVEFDIYVDEATGQMNIVAINKGKFDTGA